ncbi:SusD/RagB family nutrient-binding outer membrane lipoprotein [Polaribacter cellanae]|uniref:SusD/RagB family nutrient-binding outer membrane lipoprotein n=1 Tax=Polaribacter cellanae TaxID=2818493 RepID=A0A975H6R6_9FLAO|nr:SusD/RagB family nutrient-binding outer membrane lipoprotein [Polaribacter cellanae]QTE22199.1 SusD/RagB family nutrient-binding outer membrane lipoprotein [Polaribacter cellanae]
MKSIYKKNRNKGLYLMLLFMGFLSFNSCDNDFGDINDGYEAKLYKANIPGLFNGMVASLKFEDTRYKVPMAWLYQWNQQAAMYGATGFRLDDAVTPAWRNYYATLANYNDLLGLIAKEEVPENYKNVEAMAKIIIAYKTLSNTLLYGNMPYSEAGKGFLTTDSFRPVYEDQQSIMKAAISNLTAAIGDLSTSTSQFSLGSSETLLGNDVNMWKKFANSVRLNAAMIMIEKDEAFAAPIITASLEAPLLTSEEYVSLDPGKIAGLQNNREWYFRGNSYLRMGSTMFNEMSSTTAVDGSGIYDLRTSILFEPNEDDKWIPYPQISDASTPTVTGDPHIEARVKKDWTKNRSNFATFNVYYVQDHSIPQFLITGSQVSFLKAEIYNRGLAGIAADQAKAKTFYEEGITASVNFWYNHAFNSIWDVNKPAAAAPTSAELTAMLTNPEVAYSSNASDALTQIYKQSWIALIHQPIEAWTLKRRTGDATPGVQLPATSLVTDFNRLVYPPSERETNRVNWTAATGGTDSEKVKTWIQK